MLLRIFIFICCLITYTASKAQDTTDTIYSVDFSGYSSKLTKKSKFTLSEIARKSRSDPNGYFIITSNCSFGENEKFNTSSWDRVNNIVNHLVKKEKINENRFIYRNSDHNGNCNTIHIATTNEKMRDTLPPHPNLRRKN